MPTLGDIAKALDLPFHGNPDTALSRLASLESAGEGDLSFVAQKNFQSYSLPRPWVQLFALKIG